jgi:hypothetical protein
MNKYGIAASLLLALGLLGCKVEVSTSSGGSVKSASAIYSCTTNSPCIIDVVDYYFDEAFIPVANPGYAFTGWRPGMRVYR